MRRSPAVADRFYPGDAAALRRMIAEFTPDRPKKKALAVMAPHAGYIYSGGVAGETFAAVSIPEDIILMGPNHHGYGATVALMTEGSWEMPMGEVPINPVLAEILLHSSSHIEADDLAHRFEHSLEVEIPFLQYLQPNLSLTPLVISHLSLETCQAVGKAIASAVREYSRPVLIVASSDMSHYLPRAEASRNDHLALKQLELLAPQGLYDTVLNKRISMCGVMPTTIALIAALELGARQAELVRYTDSGEVSGDTDQVVGYAGVIIS